MIAVTHQVPPTPYTVSTDGRDREPDDGYGS